MLQTRDETNSGNKPDISKCQKRWRKLLNISRYGETTQCSLLQCKMERTNLRKSNNQDVANLESSSESLLDILPEDAVENIVRFMSQRPRRKNWSSFIIPSDVHTLYLIGGPLTEVCRRKFKSVSTAVKFASSTDSELYLNDGSASTIFQAVMETAGSSFRHISISHHRPRMEMSSNLVQTFRAYGTSVQSLDISGIGESSLVNAILRIYGQKITTLRTKCSNREFVDSIRRHCVGLRELSLVRMHRNIAPLLCALGPSLVKISLDYGIWKRTELENIQEYCRSLREIIMARAIAAESNMNLYIADLYVSIGTQLEYAVLSRMEADQCRRIINACPNVRISAQVLRNPADILNALSPCLEKLQISFLESAELEELADAAALCTNLKELTAITYSTGPSLAVISALFSSEKPNLKKLSIRDLKSHFTELIDPRFTGTLEAIERHTGGLINFSYEGFLPPANAFKGIVLAYPMLEHAHLRLAEEKYSDGISFGRFQLYEEESIVNIIEAFSLSTSLRELIVNDMPFVSRLPISGAIADACNVFRYKNVHVRICGANYYP